MIRTFIPILFASIAALTTTNAAERTPQVHLAGDSTMCNYPAESPIRGWGMALGRHFIDPAMVHNHAVGGRSTKSFVAEGRWEKLLAEVQPGDFVIIQFAHNDEKVERPKVGTDVATEFPDNLRRMVREVREKQATALLATPVARRRFDQAGKLVPTHGEYPEAIRSVAKALDAPLLDLERATNAWLQREGAEESKKYFVGLTPGAHAPSAGAAPAPDNTHFLELGAQHVAELAVAQIRALNLPLARWLKPSNYRSFD